LRTRIDITSTECPRKSREIQLSDVYDILFFFEINSFKCQNKGHRSSTRH